MKFSKIAVLPFAVFLVTGVMFAGPDAPGVPNFHQVDTNVYRGAQPSREGFQSLAKLGVKTVIDLREPGSRSAAEQKIVESNGMRYISIPFSGYSAPTAEQVAHVLSLFDNTHSGPVFVHCRRGADRTGTVVACYRIAHDHWECRKALSEAKSFGMSRFEVAMQHYVLHYQASPAAASAVQVPSVAVTAP